MTAKPLEPHTALPPTKPVTRTKDSDHDHNRDCEAEDGQRNRDHGGNEPGTSAGDPSDGAGENRPNSARPRSCTAQGKTPRAEDSGVAATLTAGPDGEIWVAVEGRDIEELDTRISEVCALLRR
ncbi:hypothetical protein GCM10027360_26750 [Amycolatopsis echigonensis]